MGDVSEFFGPTHKVPVPSHFDELEARSKGVRVDVGARVAAAAAHLLGRGILEMPKGHEPAFHEVTSKGPTRVRDVRVCLSMGHPVVLEPASPEPATPAAPEGEAHEELPAPAPAPEGPSPVLLLAYDDKGGFRGVSAKGKVSVSAQELVDFEGELVVATVVPAPA